MIPTIIVFIFYKAPSFLWNIAVNLFNKIKAVMKFLFVMPKDKTKVKNNRTKATQKR